jgi:hypothetical protein
MPHPIPQHELQLLVEVVVLALGMLLGLEKTLANLHEEGIAIAQQRVHRLCLSCPCGVRKVRREEGETAWPAIHHLERRGAEGHVEGSIVTILRPRKPVGPGARPIPREVAKVHCDHLVDNLGLPVRLWVECRAQAGLDTSHLEEVEPHVTGEG